MDFGVESSSSAQPLTGPPISIAVQMTVPLPEQRLGFGVGADLLAGEPAAVPRQGQPEAMPPGAHGLILDAALGLA